MLLTDRFCDRLASSFAGDTGENAPCPNFKRKRPVQAFRFLLLCAGQIVRKHGCTGILEAVCKTGGQGNAGDALGAFALDSRTVDLDRDLPQLAGRRFNSSMKFSRFNGL